MCQHLVLPNLASVFQMTNTRDFKIIQRYANGFVYNRVQEFH